MKARRRCQAGSMPVPIARMKRAVREGQEEKRPASPSTPTTGSPKRRLLVLRLARLRCSRTEGGIDRIWFVPRLGSSGGGERSSAWSGSLTKPVCYVDCHWKAAQAQRPGVERSGLHALERRRATASWPKKISKANCFSDRNSILGPTHGDSRLTSLIAPGKPQQLWQCACNTLRERTRSDS